MGAQIQDDAFHEIQLNGKQLVFLFMAATVVSVVIFLCGVLVGRGVRAERTATNVDGPAMTAVAAAETTPQQPAVPPTATPAGADPTAAAPPPVVDDLSYVNRLQKPNQAADDLKPAAASTKEPAFAAPKSASAAKPAASKPAKNAAEEAAQDTARAPTASAAEPAGSGYTVQVAALNVRSEAEAIAKRLSSKGYAAYVSAPATGAPSVFRVRVGRFGTRREAETVATKLQKEEQFQPWITR